MLSDSCRLRQLDHTSGNNGIKLQLEVCKEDKWISVMAYEISNGKATRHEYSLKGKIKSIKMDLPPGPLEELMQNDLILNWQSYCDKFLAGKKQSG